MLNTILAAQLDIAIKQNDDTQFTLAFTDPNNSNNAYDLSQFTTLKMQLRNKNILALTLELNSGLQVSGAENNLLTITLDQSITNLRLESYSYDVEGSDGTDKTTILEGTMSVSEDVTR
jgi:hypothetical protein